MSFLKRCFSRTITQQPKRGLRISDLSSSVCFFLFSQPKVPGRPASLPPSQAPPPPSLSLTTFPRPTPLRPTKFHGRVSRLLASSSPFPSARSLMFPPSDPIFPWRRMEMIRLPCRLLGPPFVALFNPPVYLVRRLCSANKRIVFPLPLLFLVPARRFSSSDLVSEAFNGTTSRDMRRHPFFELCPSPFDTWICVLSFDEYSARPHGSIFRPSFSERRPKRWYLLAYLKGVKL